MPIKRMTSLLITYLLLLLAAFVLQRNMIYFPARYTAEQQEALLAYLNLQPWPSSGDVRGMISKSPLPNAKGTVLVFHGNAGSAADRGYYIEALQRLGYRVIIAEYPGYGARTGAPSEQALIKDGIETAQLVWQQFNTPLLLCGESLGSGVVAGIVASRQVPVKGLLLITPFDAMNRVAQHHYWFLLGKWLLRDIFDNLTRLRDFSGNIAVILAEQDEIIPPRHTLALFETLTGPKKLWRFEGAGHNTLPLQPSLPWWREAMAFIDR